MLNEMEPSEKKSYDIVEILSTSSRDFLIRNNGEKVKVDSLRGKFIVVHFVPFVGECMRSKDLRQDAVNRYNDLVAKGDFELVLVALVETNEETDKRLFEMFFSQIPWLRIPRDDVMSRQRLCELFDMTGCRYPMSFLLDGKGVLIAEYLDSLDCVLFHEDLNDFYRKKEKQLAKETWEKDTASITKILSTPSRDYLVTNNGEKVLVSELEGKVVGIYYNDRIGMSTFDETVVEIYKQLKEREENFEIVEVNYFEEFENEFKEKFKSRPWLAWPVEDKEYLNRMFSVLPESLVMFGPGRKFLDKHGADVIEAYGIKAYPFTRERAVEMEVARLKALRLEYILTCQGHNKFVINNCGSEIPIHEQSGKIILLLIADSTDSESTELFEKLMKWYNEIKHKDEPLEVIYVSLDNNKSSFDKSLKEMPWLAIPFDKLDLKFLLEEALGLESWICPIIAAFGKDGQIQTKRAHKMLEEDGHKVDPFSVNDEDFFWEIYDEIAYIKFWTVTDKNGDEYKIISQ